MGQVLHGSATRTEAIRRAIQRSQESLRTLAKRYGVNQKTSQVEGAQLRCGHADRTDSAKIDGAVGRRGRDRDPPPLKWSALEYDFRPEEDADGEEETQARGDRRQIAPGRCVALAGQDGSRGDPLAPVSPKCERWGFCYPARYPRSPSHRLRAKGQHNQLTLLVDTLGSFQDLLNGDQDLPEVCVWRIQGHFLGINTYLKACKASTFRSRVVG